MRELDISQPAGTALNGAKRASALLVVTVISAMAISGCARKAPATATNGPMPVSVITVQQSDVPLTGEWVGTLDGNVNAQIQPQVSGYLIRQNYREGSTVSKGQVLFEIDPRPFQAALDQAQGQLGQAKAQLGLAQINVKRDTPLAEAHAIARSQLDTETQQMIQAEASVKAAEAAVAYAKLNLGFTQVRSLVDGVAGQATTQVGNLVSPQSVLTSVSQLNPIRVYFSISDSEYLALTEQSRKGHGSLLSNTAKIPLTLTLADGETYPRKGTIAFVDRQMNSQTGAIRIAGVFPNPGNILRPGQFGRVKAETEVRRDVVLVPQIAVQELQGQEQVYTVSADHKVHVVDVQLGQQFGNDWIVNSGLASGTTVILDNLQKLREGVPVNPHPAATTANPNQSAGK
ncbi:MAG TPA: efflux RND transporter periplasmic adaptor subunit [Acidisarcina sp.]|nr:efflux RND transporter periplasmic adaptor subunit [Acidisarcina sp.]